MWPQIKCILITLAINLITLFVGFQVYRQVMCGGVWSIESATDAAYYSAQTLTTVGYGDWALGLDPKDERVREMKKFSVFFMLFGAVIFAMLIAAIAQIYPGNPTTKKTP